MTGREIARIRVPRNDLRSTSVGQLEEVDLEGADLVGDGDEGARTIGEVQRERAAAEIADMQRHPAVAAVLQQFPDAEITSVRQLPQLDKDDTGTG